MDANNWTQLWLTYQRIEDIKGDWNISYSGFDMEHRIVESGVYEFRNALEGLTGENVIISQDEEKNQNASTLFLVRDEGIPAQGYFVDSDEKGREIY